MRAKPDRAIPVPTPLTQPFWDACKERKLAIQRCQDCKHYFHPPTPVCLECYSTNLTFEPVSGRGKILANTIMHDPRIRGWGEDVVPFAVIVVELDEEPGLALVSNLLGVPAADAKIGRRVKVDFEEIGEGFVVPQFRLDEAAAPA